MQIPFKPTALAIALACLVPAGLAFAAEPQAAPPLVRNSVASARQSSAGLPTSQACAAASTVMAWACVSPL